MCLKFVSALTHTAHDGGVVTPTKEWVSSVVDSQPTTNGNGARYTLEQLVVKWYAIMPMRS